MDTSTILTYVGIAVIIYIVLQLIGILLRNIASRNTKPEQLEITTEVLKFYQGLFGTQIWVAIKGEIYDVTKDRDQYGEGGPLHCYAGREISRALATGSKKAEDCVASLEGCSEAQVRALDEQILAFSQKYAKVGKIVPMKDLTPAQLAEYDGRRDPSKPIYLSIKGIIYDVTGGRQFYGPNGMYPFGGKEVARALAKFSLEDADCNSDLTDLSPSEITQLNDWIQNFQSKYPIVGNLVIPPEDEQNFDGDGADDGDTGAEDN